MSRDDVGQPCPIGPPNGTPGLRALDVDVHPLVVARGVGKRVHPLLGALDPVAGVVGGSSMNSTSRGIVNGQVIASGPCGSLGIGIRSGATPIETLT
jgi:hypothetical protein